MVFCNYVCRAANVIITDYFGKSRKMKVIKCWLPLVIIIGMIASAWASGLMELVSLDAIKQQRGELLSLVEAHPVLSVLAFVAIYAGAVALSLPVATVLTLLGGFLFGSLLGTVAIVTGATLGATILFLIARSALGETLRDKCGSLYDKVAANMEENAISYMLFMRLVPLFPFFLVNIVPALFNVRLIPYVLTTMIGIIPGTFVYANVGRELGTIDSLGDLASPQTLMAFTLLGLFALIPMIYKKIKGRRKSVAMVVAALMVMSPNVMASDNYDRFSTLYDGLLQSYVSPNSSAFVNKQYMAVDYDGWAEDKRHGEALKILQAENGGDMAFWINAYNFLTIDLIVRENERETIKNLGSMFTSPWKKHSWDLGGKSYTLNHIEHEILRPMGDARIHFAINCASISCPDLRGEAYRSEILDKQLEEQVLLTLGNEGKGLSLNGNNIKISKIFKWFEADFNGGDVKGWLQSYISLNKQVKLQYLNYDWSLNKPSEVEK